MKISAIIKAVLAPQGDQTGPGLTDLKPGDQLIGKVLKQQADGRVIIELGQRRVSAQVGFSVKAGQRLNLQVVETGSVLHLRADTSRDEIRPAQPLPLTDFSKVMSADQQARFMEIAARLIGEAQQPGSDQAHGPKNIENALARIMTVFEDVPLEKSAVQVSRWLKTAVENRGLLLEKQMADMTTVPPETPGQGEKVNPNANRQQILISRDIKSQLLQLREHLGASDITDPPMGRADPREISFLRRSVDRMLGHIEQQQDRAVARWNDGDNQQVMVHTLPLPDQNKPVRLKLYYPRKDSDKGNGGGGLQRIALLLDMDKLGDVRVDLTMIDRMLQIGFFVTTARVQQMMAGHVREVEDALAGVFEKISIHFHVSKEKVAAFETEDVAVGDVGNININV